jgi:replicative DNA helicase
MDIEKTVIGSLIKNPDAIPEVHEILKHGDFQDFKAGFFYSAIVDMVKEDVEVDLITVAKRIGDKVDFAWLAEASDLAMSLTASKRYAKIISDMARAKRLASKLKALAAKIDAPDEALSEMLDIYASELGGDSKSGHIADVVKRFRILTEDNSKGEYGITTGYTFLDAKYIKYMPGHIWIIGGHTSVGKTATMTDMLCRALESQDPTIAIISTEMKEEQNVARFLARQTGFHSQVMLSGHIHNNSRSRMDVELEWFSQRSIYLYDDLYSMQDIEMRLRQLNMRKPLDIVFIDYIQNMTYAGAKSEYESKSEIAKGLQRIAKQLNCCIVCLSQVSNSAAKDDDEEVLEYKGAGEIAAVADIGIRLKRSKQNREHLMFCVRKNRHGQTGKQVLSFVNNFTRLEEINHEENC